MSFKVRLLLGAAAPFVFALPAAAQVTISTATTTPIATSNNGSPSDISITGTGSVSLTNQPGATAVNINTNNSVNNAGTISTTDSDNSTGLHIGTNLSANYTAAGAITLLQTYTRTDTDNDGDLDGPLAQGTGRIGILLDAGGTLTGNINLASTSAVTVQGNNSSAISLRSALLGNYRQKGSVTVTGSNNIAIDFQQNVTGNVGLGGATTAQGEGAIGVRVLGNVTGEFMIDGGVTSTGFTSTSPTDSNYVDPDDLKPGDKTIAERRDADDLLVGGSAVEIHGDLSRGLLVNGPATGGVDPTDTVKDVVQDFNENRTAGTISTFGSAPALLIQSLNGAAGDQINLGKVRESVPDTLDDDKDSNLDEIIGVFDYDFGFINRGSIIASGLNVGFAATGVKIAGSADGTHATIVDGGIFNGGQITAQAFEANAIGLNIGSGASTPQLVNNGNISAGVNTETNHDATAVRIDAGATVPSVTNNGLIFTNVRGYDGDTIAFQDLSGTVTSFRNNSRISAGYTDNNTSDTITSGLGRAIAIDLSHTSSNLTLTQTDAADNTRIFGDVLFGGGSDRFDILSGEVAGNVDFGAAGSDVLQLNSAKLTGDVTFRGASSNISLIGGEMAGALSLGAGPSTLSFTNGSIYNGAITGAGTKTMVVDNSTMNNSAAGTLTLSSMNVANNSKVGFVIDNARVASGQPIFNVTGTADIAANTLFTPIFKEFTDTDFTLRVLNAGTLNLGGPVASMLSANSPYLYAVSLTRPTGLNALDLTLRVKDPGELGLNTRQTTAYGAVLDLMEQESQVGAAVTSIPGAAEFLRSWSDLLPASDVTVMKVLASNATAAFGATAHRLDLVSDKPDAPGGAWTEEFGVYHQSDPTGEGLAVTGGGFGVSAGIDLLASRNHLIGAFAALESVELEEENRTGAPLNVSQTTIGAYGGWRSGGLALNGSAGVGFAKFTSDRELKIGTLADRLRADWNGLTYNAAARATYTLPLGLLDVKPYIAADYMGFQQDGYTERANTLSDLAIVAQDGDATLATASYGLSFVGNFGSDGAYSVKPQLSVGYRNVLTWDDTAAPMRFSGGSAGTTFALDPGAKPEDAVVAGLGLNIDSQFLNIHVGYDAEISDNSTTHYGSVTLRMAFW